MRTWQLHFALPEDLIAQEPAGRREQCRLMVLRPDSRTLEHRTFADLPELLRPGDVLVLNCSKVLPAQFDALRATGGRIGALFVSQLAPGTWEVLLRGRGRLRDGEGLRIADGRWRMRLLERLERGLWRVAVDPAEPAETILAQVGRMPLPPYIQRTAQDPRTALDREWYQTVFARESGSVAAPTAGLHFSEGLLQRLRERGIDQACVTLHVGLGTFQPIEVDDLAEHRMHAETYELPAEAAEKINRSRAAGGRIVAVGTTSARVLETCARDDGTVAAARGSTGIFIYPPYRFRGLDALITNFHLPGSTLLALVFAFAGRQFVLQAYEEAVRERYRFFSYGDAMIIL